MTSVPAHIRSTALFAALAAACALAPTAHASPDGEATPPAGKVYTLTNAPSGNGLLAFDRMADGSLVPAGNFQTGGTGTGGGLGNQGALALSESGDWLLAVNPGSDSVSVFLLADGVPELTDTVDSGGSMPVSVAIAHGIVYVLNAGSDEVEGFRLGVDGHLAAIGGSSRPLSGSGTGAAQVGFNRAGDLVAVTEKATGKILAFPVDGDGLLGPVVMQDSPTPTPFGFAFGRRDELFVSEAAGGMPGASAMSSYQLGADASFNLVTSSSPSGETAACWVATTRDGAFAFTTNTGSDTVTSYQVAPDGTLGLDEAMAGMSPAGSAPTDVAIDRDNAHLYVLNPGTRTISAFGIAGGGSLKLIENQPLGRISVMVLMAPTGLVAY